MAPRYYRKIIRIRATDSPNVRLGLAQQAKGETPTNEVIVPGVLTFAEYEKRLATWDEVRKCIGLSAEFYEGAEILLFPPLWLDAAEQFARSLTGRVRKARAIGIDPAEGGDKTSMSAVDEFGLIEMVSKRTPDTNVVTSEALAFMRKHGVEPEQVAFDRGGGGKQHADRMRADGHNVRTIAFGEAIALQPKRGTRQFKERVESIEERYTYTNRRTEMYHELSMLCERDAAGNPVRGHGFAIMFDGPIGQDLRKQLSVFPKLLDGESRYYLPSKNKRTPDDTRKTLVDMIGHSPDEADSLVLAVHAMLHVGTRTKAGAVK